MQHSVVYTGRTDEVVKALQLVDEQIFNRNQWGWHCRFRKSFFLPLTGGCNFHLMLGNLPSGDSSREVPTINHNANRTAQIATESLFLIREKFPNIFIRNCKMSECQGEWDEGISYKFSKRGSAITHPRSVDGCKEHCRSIAKKFYCLSLALFRFIARFSVRSRTLRCFFPPFVRVNNKLQSSLFIQSHGSIDTPFSMRPAAGCLFVNYESEWIIRVGVVDVCDAICSSILTSSFLAAVWVDSPIAANDVQSDWAQSHSAFAPSILHSRNSSAFSISDSSLKASPKGERIWWRRQLVCSHVTRSAERCFSLIFFGPWKEDS